MVGWLVSNDWAADWLVVAVGEMHAGGKGEKIAVDDDDGGEEWLQLMEREW